MFSILPSCSEGSPGTVVDSMQQGLIPVLTKEAGIDVAGFGYILDNYKIDTIKKQIISLPEIDNVRLADLSLASKKEVTKNFSAEMFEKNFKTGILSLLSHGDLDA